MRDGVGERLISLNPASINVPAYKNAGWGAAAEIRRTYSPPIPSGAGAEYFTNPPLKPISLGDGTFPLALTGAPERREDNGDAGDGDTLAGLASHFSNESTELAVDKPEARRRKRRERELHREDDDSSDMSDDSDDDESSQTWVFY